MKTSYKKAFEFQQVALAYLEDVKEETKLSAALQEVVDQIPEHAETYNKLRRKKERSYASTDSKTTCILRDERGQYKYTIAQEEALEDELNEIYEDENTVYIEHEYVQDEDIPKDLHRQLRKIFAGFVIKPKEEEKPKVVNLPSAKNLIEKAKLK